MRKKYDTVLFDLDGTLLNTLEDLRTALNRVMEEYGEPTHSLDEVRQYVGNGVRKLMERAIPDGLDCPTFEEQLEKNKRYYIENDMDKTEPYPGIMEMLAEAKSRGVKCGIVSNKDHPAVVELADHFFKGYVDGAIGNGENRRVKPFPDGPIELCMRLFSKRGTTLYVGDSEVDAQTAYNAQMDCVLVSWGFRPREILEKQKALAVIDDPRELYEYFI